MENKNKKPKLFLITKILGFVFVCLAIAGIGLTITGFGDFETNNFMIGSIMTCVGLFAGISCLNIGFSPEIQKLSVKTKKYIQSETKEDLKDISNTTAEISSEAITKYAKAVKKGMKETIFCKYCGEQIDKDSIYCNKCGKQIK